MTNNEARFILLNSEHTKSSDVVEAYITYMIIFSGLGESPFTLWDESEIIDDFNQWLYTEQSLWICRRMMGRIAHG